MKKKHIYRVTYDYHSQLSPSFDGTRVAYVSVPDHAYAMMSIEVFCRRKIEGCMRVINWEEIKVIDLI